MVVDSSAILAIVQHEAEEHAFTRLIGVADRVLISAVNYVECAIILGARRGVRGEEWFDRFLAETQIEVVPVTKELADAARRAYFRYGKGHDEARLNLADVFSYALAKSTGEPLLFKGGDFAKTDIAAAV